MRFPGLLLLAVLAAGIGSAQPVVMARTGAIDAAEGDVSLNGQRVLVKFGSPISVAPGESLVTKTGRAEIILGPGAWLRVAQNSSVRLVSDSTADVHVELLSGSVIVDSGTTLPITVEVAGHVTTTSQPVSYRLDSNPQQIRYGNGPVQTLTGDVIARPTEAPDRLFDLWSGERHSLLASNLTGPGTGDALLDTGQTSNEPIGQAFQGSDEGTIGFIAPFGPLYPSYVPYYDVPPVYPIYPGFHRQPGAIGPGIMYPPGTIPTLHVPGGIGAPRGPGVYLPRGAGRR